MIKNQRGDTIIEVLFAMTIIGVVLAAAYSVASKNLQVSQFSKERTIATELAVGQIDQLKSLEEAPSPPGGGSFCLDVTASNYVINSADAECTDGFYSKSITKTGNQYQVIVEWIPPGGDDANKAIVEMFYTDYNFDISGASGVSVYTISYSGGATATLGASIIDVSGSPPRGIVYGTSSNPTLGDGTSTVLPNANIGSNSFSTVINGLTPGSTYYARVYVSRASGTVYSNTITISNSAPAALATVNTVGSSSVRTTTATVSGEVITDNGSAVTSRGVAYGTISSPTITGGFVAAGSGTGAFSANIGGLQSGVTYYARAYATNANGTAYGNQISFTTTTVAVNGSSYTSCTNTETPGGGACQNVGTSVVNCQDYRVNYNVNNPTNHKFGSLVISYADYDCAGAGFPTPPSSLYSYRVNIYVDGVLNVSNVSLPVNGSPRTITLDKSKITNFANVSVHWTNNEWVPNGSNPYGYDPDLRITRFELRD